MQTKKCESCGIAFNKPTSSSIKTWEGARYCSSRCMGDAMKGKKLSKERRDKLVAMITSPEVIKNRIKAIPRGKNNHNWKGGKVQKICEECGTTYKVKPYLAATQVCCSHKCNRVRRSKMAKENVCSYCKIEFKVKKNPQREYKYCSAKCRASHNSEQSKIHKSCVYCGVGFSVGYHYRGQKCCSSSCANKLKDMGKTSEAKRIRASKTYKEWRKAVFERDKYMCVECGQLGGTLQADHIKPFCLFPELRLDVNNGRTLCESCHRKTDTFARGALNFKEAI